MCVCTKLWSRKGENRRSRTSLSLSTLFEREFKSRPHFVIRTRKFRRWELIAPGVEILAKGLSNPGRRLPILALCTPLYISISYWSRYVSLRVRFVVTHPIRHITPFYLFVQRSWHYARPIDGAIHIACLCLSSFYNRTVVAHDEYAF